MLINLHIRNFRSIRKADISFKADRDDMTAVRLSKEGDTEHRLLKTADPDLTVVPVKNIIGLSSFGKTTLIDALYVLKDVTLGTDVTQYYTPCLESPEFAKAPIEISADFTLEHKHKRFNATYGVTFTEKGLIDEKLFIEDEADTHFRITDGIITQKSDAVTGESEYLKGNCPGGKTEGQSFLCYLSQNAPDGIIGSAAFTLTHGFFFLFLDDISAHATVSAFEEFSLSVAPFLENVKDHKEEFLLSQLSHFMKDMTGIESLRHEINDQGVNSLFAVHKCGKESYELDFNYESDSTRATFLVLIHILKSILVGAVAIIDDFNTHLHPYAQIYLPKLFKSERNELEAQLIIVHHGEKIMIPDGEECADELCCLNRSPEGGTVAVSGRELIKSSNVEFAHGRRRGKMPTPPIKQNSDNSESVRTVTTSKRKNEGSSEANAKKSKSKNSQSVFYFESDEES